MPYGTSTETVLDAMLMFSAESILFSETFLQHNGADVYTDYDHRREHTRPEKFFNVIFFLISI